MELKDSHGGFAGRSLVEKIQIEAVKALKEYMECGRKIDGINRRIEAIDQDNIEELAFHDGFAQGICKALAVLRSSSLSHEVEAMNDRYQNFIVVGSFGLGDEVMAAAVENGTPVGTDDEDGAADDE